MTLKPGNEITTVEQLENLPDGAILKLKNKENGLLNVGLVNVLRFLGVSTLFIDTPKSMWGPSARGELIEHYTITVLDIPEHEWKPGDTVETWEQTRQLPEHTVLESTIYSLSIWVKHGEPENAWRATNTNVWADEEDPINRVYFPMRILRLGNGEQEQ